MTGSVNKVTLIGNLGKDPEIRSTQNGSRIANLVVATGESWKDKDSGEWKKKTEWHRVAIFNDHFVGIAEKHLSKGMQVYVEGQLQTRKWVDQNGQDKYSTEIVLSKFKGELTLLESPQKEERAPQPAKSSDIDDEIPF